MKCEKSKAFGYTGCPHEATTRIVVSMEYYDQTDRQEFCLCDECVESVRGECLIYPGLTIEKCETL